MKHITENQFTRYSLSPELIEALTLLGYTEPTDIQQAAIPLILEGRDVMAMSRTGSGKTAAFAIPLCEAAVWEENLPGALVLEPTRELAMQVRDEIFYIGRKRRLKVPALFGGFPIDKQIQTLRQKAHIVVGTPGRVLDHIRRDTIKLLNVRCLVIDEADLMLDMGFMEDVRLILENLQKGCQIVLFSATMHERVRALAEAYMDNPLSLIQKAQMPNELEEILYGTDADNKYEILLRVLIQENPEQSMIFCGTREMVNVLCRKLKRDRISCAMLHGDMDQKERIQTIEDFRTGRFRHLIATDVAARGVDFEHITHVIQYDFPTGRETYVHRAGRAGRNGRKGRAVSLVTPDEQKMKNMVEEYLGRELPVLECPLPDSEAEHIFRARQKEKTIKRPKKGAALHAGITRLSIGGGRKSKMRAADIVGAVCHIEGIEAEDIGIIDVRDSMTHVEILNGKGRIAAEALLKEPIKGKLRKVKITGRL